MSEKLSLRNPENAKKLAKKVSKATDLSHSESLEFIAKELGFTSWHNYIKVCGKASPGEESRGIELCLVNLDIDYDKTVSTGLFEVSDWEESLLRRFKITVDSKTDYDIDNNSESIFEWLRDYSKTLDYEIYVEGVDIKWGIIQYGFSLELSLGTSDLDAAKRFATDFFSFLNTLNQ